MGGGADGRFMEYRTECEKCRAPLPPDGSAYFCSHECTFCATCVRRLAFVCPNCGGELVRRPPRVVRGGPKAAKIPEPDLTVTVRRAEARDVDALAPLFDAYRVFYHQPSDPSAARRFLEERLSRAESTVLLAEDKGAAVGFAQLYPTFTSITLGPIYVLYDLFVAPSHRRRGVGALLLGAARDFGVASGAHYLELTTAVDNPAQHLYETLGWLPDRDYLHYELPLQHPP
jgi:hypothetical protein